ncbi:2-oxo-4-hydroxy-4-carboxy-5-ureidoimidazoline decarboxylase [Roseiterribacter gracilis]|uniref:2-oxo-4-hydroxy-4-carboxy-5-ureidoimidazoline decarboxylase n=1 Tax=Roseiterribacter gracilis TaxID=2812848 RepID=A0A8S8XDC9_9PROT|nr:OHCU decarboxylase [Rhodospirillales bacterium TMPK1]
MDRDTFVARFASVFEHSPWIAQRAWEQGIGPDQDNPDGLHAALCAVLAKADRSAKIRLVQAHPDLAGKLAIEGGLTQESRAEQASAGLDQCSPDEFARFQTLNATYTKRFGFPFVIAVRGLSRAQILAAFEQRVGNDPDQELATALVQIERIALLRIRDLFAAA